MQRLNLEVGRPRLLETAEETLQTCAQFRETGIVAVDTEATGLDTMRDVPLFVSLSNLKHRVAVRVGGEAFSALADIFQDTSVIKCLHNAKFDVHMLANVGMTLRGPWHDTLVMSSMSDTSRSSQALKELLKSLYGPTDSRFLQYNDFSHTFGRPGKNKTAGQLLKAAPLDKVLQYATCDAWGTFQIYQTLKAQLESITTWRGETLWDLFLRFEVPFTKVLYDMERRGVRIDAEKLSQLGSSWTNELEELERKFAQAVGRPINIRSVHQLRAYFLGDRKLTTGRRTAGGEGGETKDSLDKVTLETWARAGVAEAEMVIRHRLLTRLVRTYVEPLLRARDHHDRVHTTYTQMVQTGRLASDSPNLQNIPARTKDGKRIRECFVSSPGHQLVVRDYDQLEMKLAAALSGDPNMIKIIRDGKDIHSGNAAMAFGAPYEGIQAAVKAKDEAKDAMARGESPPPLSEEFQQYLTYRDRAKTIGFETLYGGGLRKLAVLLGFGGDREGLEKAADVQRRFFAPFQQLLRYIKQSHMEAKTGLAVQTITGRYRSLPAVALEGTPAQAEAYRQAFNTKIQGSGADAVKLAMINAANDPELINNNCLLLLQVHDEIIVEVPDEHTEFANARLGEHMTDSLPRAGLRLPFPLTSSGKWGLSWGSAK